MADLLSSADEQQSLDSEPERQAQSGMRDIELERRKKQRKTIQIFESVALL